MERIFDDIKEEITCCLCVDLFEDPRFLYCGHSLCKECILSIYDNSKNKDLNCPICRKDFEIKDREDINNLPKNFDVANIVEKIKNFKPLDINNTNSVMPSAPPLTFEDIKLLTDVPDIENNQNQPKNDEENEISNNNNMEELKEDIKFSPFIIQWFKVGIIFEKWKKSTWFAPLGFQLSSLSTMHSFYVPYYILDILVRVKYTGEVRKTIHNLDGELDYRWNRISCSRSSAYNDVISIACSSEEKYYDVMSRIKFNEDSFNDNSTGIVYKIVQGFSSILGLKKSTNNIDLDIEAEDIPQLPFIDWRICLERKKKI